MRQYVFHFGDRRRAYQGGAITAVVQEEIDEEVKGVVYNVGVSFCSPKDQFVRKLGNIKALGMIKSSQNHYSHTYVTTEKKSLADIELLVIRFLAGLGKSMPSWIRKPKDLSNLLDKSYLVTDDNVHGIEDVIGHA